MLTLRFPKVNSIIKEHSLYTHSRTTDHAFVLVHALSTVNRSCFMSITLLWVEVAAN